MSENTLPLNQHAIPVERAAEMTRRFRENRSKILNPDVAGKDILPTCETFHKDAFARFFSNPKVKALRIYYGMSEDLQVHAIIVGVNEKNEDILPGRPTGALSVTAGVGTETPFASGDVSVSVNADDTEDTETETGDVLEDAVRCPPSCPPPSELND